MAVVDIPRGDLFTAINFVKPLSLGDEPYYMYVRKAPPEGVPIFNLQIESHNTTIHDLRGIEDSVNFDNDSLKLLKSAPVPTGVEFESEESVKKIHYPSVEKQIREAIPDATKIVVFRHAVRKTDNPAQYAPAALFAHVDQTAPAVADRVRRHLGSQADSLLKGRYRLVHHWQVINEPVQTFPLAFASAATVGADDIAPIVSHLPDFSEDFGTPRFRESQKWFYWSGVTPNEAILMQLFDSAASDPASGVKGGRAIHSAFVDPRTAADAPPRFSIESSVLVFGP
ncbi:hypothetical protein B0O99DRAFT_640794 [Bisporella sp. PMI_857]|nr:hypothetical protein B0O99DRAFT_640794 [Bisporella sp. PMI_857]